MGGIPVRSKNHQVFVKVFEKFEIVLFSDLKSP